MAKAKAEVTFLKGGKTCCPVGVAAYAYLSKPDTLDEEKPKYTITVGFPNAKTDPEFKRYAEKLTEFKKVAEEETGKKMEALPFKVVDEKFAEKTGWAVGTLFMTFATRATKKEGDRIVEKPTIPVFNAANPPVRVDNEVYGGDIVRVEAGMAYWIHKGKLGLKGYLGSVQLLKSNWSGGAGSTFSADAEYADVADAEEGEGLDEDGSSFSSEYEEEEATDTVGTPTFPDDDDPKDEDPLADIL